MSMLNGLIVEDHRIIALDLKNTLSRSYNILGIVTNADEALLWKNYDAHFIIMDTDIRGSFSELQKIIDILNCAKSKIILLSSAPEELLHPSTPYTHIVYKPFNRQLLLEAIES